MSIEAIAEGIGSMAPGAGTADAPKPLLEQILEWSEKSLPEWQRDALRRLFQRRSDELMAADYGELFALLKKNNGLAAPDGLAAKPWAREHLPNTTANEEHATLKAMRDLKYVNRIAAGQSLKFGSEGMTIVYGANGSGKSGYSRVLKRACRARDQTEAVLPDATDAAQLGKVPEATFDVEVGGKQGAVTWALNKPAPDELATVAVFDGKCARAYLTTEGDVAYIPFGLDVVAGLATKVLPEVERMLTAEIAALDVDLSSLDGLRGNTKVGSLVEKFGPKTEQSELEELASVNEAEFKRLEVLEKALAEEDPLAAGKKVRLEAQRVSGLADRVDSAVKAVSNEALEKLKKLDAESVAADQAVEVAAEKLRAGEDLLAGTGGDTWRRMFEAARKYSVEVAYTAHAFPHTDDGAVCPLCQQDLEEAGERLKRFEAFLQQNTAQVADTAKKSAAAAAEVVRSASIGFQVDAALAAELAALDKNLPSAVKSFETAIEMRRKAMLTGCSTHQWGAVPALGGDPRPELRRHAQSLNEKAEGLEKAGDVEKRKTLEAERSELKARAGLKADLKKVTKLLSNVKSKGALEGCKKDLKTTGISNKAKAFSEAAVTGALREALDAEFNKLGGVPFDLKLGDRTDKGKTKYKLQMTLASGAKLEDILSEGEQRAIAIGSFLAELALAGHKGGIVFDDPVSSLDHQRKGLIARRLAEEAKVRQVIVFTHDVVFLTMLEAELKRAKASNSAHWLDRDATGRAGMVTLDDTPTNSKAYQNTNLARAAIKRAEGLAGGERVESLRHAAGQLRTTLEEIVPLHLFKDVVGRWRENLMLTKVRAINWDNAVADEIDALFADLSRIVEGHSHTEQYTGGAPQLDELKKLADRVDAVIKEAKKPRT